MPLVRWDPWRDIAALERQFDERFGRGSRSGMRAREWMPMLDVHQDGDDLVIEAELAGVDPKDVEITIENSVLRIAGTRGELEGRRWGGSAASGSPAASSARSACRRGSIRTP